MCSTRSDFVGGIIFDFDDTIIATREMRAKLLCNVALTHFGMHISKEKVAVHWGEPFNKMVKNLVPGMNVDIFLEHYMDEMRKHPPKILPGVQDIFHQAYLNHIAVFIFSSSSNKLISQDIEAGMLSNLVLKIWGWEDTSRYKPDPHALEPLLNSADKMGLDRNSLIYVGDSISDYHVASSNDISFIAVLTGIHTEKDFLLCGLPKKYIIENLSFLKLKQNAIFIRNKRVFSLPSR
jgi:phosphoglycolate phosphatase-like HAD superfamily hydrolase